MVKKKTETIVIENFGAYGLAGDIEDVIRNLQDLLEEGKEQGLTNIRLESDYHEECVYGADGYTGESEKFWQTEVKGDKDV